MNCARFILLLLLAAVFHQCRAEDAEACDEDSCKVKWDVHPHNALRDEDLPRNKFSERDGFQQPGDSARTAAGLIFGNDEDSPDGGTCSHDINLLWNVDLGSSIFATPSIVDLYSDGSKEILVPTYTHFVEAVDAWSGEDVEGWPFTHAMLETLSSMLEVDMDHDGTSEWMISTYDGKLIFLDDNGRPIPRFTHVIPRLPVLRRWANFAERQEIDENQTFDREQREAAAWVQRKKIATHQHESQTPRAAAQKPQKHEPDLTLETATTGETTTPVQPVSSSTAPPQQPQSSAPPQQPQSSAPPQPDVSDPVQPRAAAPDRTPKKGSSFGWQRGRQLQQNDEEPSADPYEDYIHQPPPDPAQLGEIPDYYREYRDYYGIDDDYDWHGQYMEDAAVEHTVVIGTEGGLSPEARLSMDLVYHPQLFRSAAEGVSPEHDPFAAAVPPAVVTTKDEIALSPHILATPVVLDIDHDGKLEAVIPVSYYLSGDDVALDGDESIDPLNYAAAAIVVLQLDTQAVKWAKMLYLTTRTISQPAFQLSSPVIVNLDDDALLDVIVTTPYGHVSAFDGRGRPIPGWPVLMGPIHAAALVEDVNGDGLVDVCAGDINGNVACFDRKGREIWVAEVDGPVAEAPSAGDVNGDGFIDVVVCTTEGSIYALDGRDGRVLPEFPFITDGPILAPVLLLNLNASSAVGLHLIVPSHDGFVYIVSGSTGCAQRLDIGASSYSMVLADDLNSNGLMDLVVTSLAGGMFVFETAAPFHPLKAWPARFHGFSGMSARYNHIGIFISPESREPRDVRGESFKLMFTIEDRRPGRGVKYHPTYFVSVTIGRRLLVLSRVYASPGSHVEHIGTPLERVYSVVSVRMMLPCGLFYEDSVALSFNMHFLETIKYALLIPFALATVALMLVRKEHAVDYGSPRGMGFGIGMGPHRYVDMDSFDDDFEDEMRIAQEYYLAQVAEARRLARHQRPAASAA